MLPFLNPHRLQTRIVAMFLGLLLIIQAVSYWFVQRSVDANARRAIQAELQTGEKVFLRLLEQNNERLAQATRVLASDYGFRAAIASNDAETMLSALENHGERIDASLALFADPEFRLQAATGEQPARFLEAVRRYALSADHDGTQRHQVELIDGQPYQIVAVPVRAPAVIGWVGMAFRLDANLLRDMQNLSGLDVALMLPGKHGRPEVRMATLPADAWPAAQSTPANGSKTLRGEYATLAVTLPGASETGTATVVLMRSVDQALSSYRDLQVTLLTLAALGVLAFGVGSVVTARRIATPLRALSRVARRLGKGDYAQAVAVRGRGEIGELAASLEAMRQAVQAREGEIRRLAFQDALTDLPNREQFRHDLRQAIFRSQDSGAPCTVLLMDMDRFKHVNDVLGHRFGDRLLRAVAERIRQEALAEHPAVLARLSGDEFAVLLPETAVSGALPIAQRIHAVLERPFTLDDHTVDLSAGIGVAACPTDGDDADLLLSRAELAMYAAKQRQAGTVVYQAGLDTGSQESLSLLSELRTAVEQDQLRLFLQPKVDLRSGQIIGAEALVRWQHPTRGMVPPMKFIPFAEQTGFIRVMTMWILGEVARSAHQLAHHGLRMKLAVNLSTRDLMDQDLPAKVEAVLQEHGVDPTLIVLEITESAIMDDPQRALQTLNRLHALGLKLSIDDFGTGYSSLAYLKRLPVDELKIDRSFVMNMESDLQDAKIVYSTIDLAHNLGLSVVAEGVEGAKHWKLLAGLGCDEAQGYFIAKPMPADDFMSWLANWRAPDTEQEDLGTAFAAMI
ncbi:putative bifunctional diguanylate cyclase/phosphodiesterase [Aquabacterium fontiphilum]|uniref:putative bifunctional diguanylate cyclase/phosphodiesterase n=1 Tax=Aquabacterium fontiphilum TaxID=450365 RepID=UPI00191BDD76|nr:EAL domain-containing protein [Aquabacterium fontiphilum]